MKLFRPHRLSNVRYEALRLVVTVRFHCATPLANITRSHYTRLARGAVYIIHRSSVARAAASLAEYWLPLAHNHGQIASRCMASRDNCRVTTDWPMTWLSSAAQTAVSSDDWTYKYIYDHRVPGHSVMSTRCVVIILCDELGVSWPVGAENVAMVKCEIRLQNIEMENQYPMSSARSLVGISLMIRFSDLLTIWTEWLDTRD